MIKKDELELIKDVLNSNDPIIYDVIMKHSIHYKRRNYILNKWVDKNWIEYGVSMRCGWLTDVGRIEMSKIITQNH